MSTSKTPFADAVKAAEHVMEHCSVPKVLFTECAGIMLLKATQSAFVFSGCDGGGLLISKNEGDGEWSNPAAISLLKFGIGASFGIAERDTVIVLNAAAMRKLMVEGNVKVSIGEDIGVAAGPVGASAAMEVGMSEKMGGASSFVYTYQKGALLNIEATTGIIRSDTSANKEMYGTDSIADILEGKADSKDEDATKAVLEKVAAFVKKE